MFLLLSNLLLLTDDLLESFVFEPKIKVGNGKNKPKLDLQC